MAAGPTSEFSAVPLFPLPSVVLFPRAVLPLHIFEDRYRAMTADALAGDRRIAMALLKPGWEKSYYGRPPIDPVVCVGEILSSEKLSDGKYNFLLQGTTRARIIRELPSEKPYRLVELLPLEQVPVLEIDLEPARQRIKRLFAESSLSRTPAGQQFARLVRSHLSTPEIADLAAFTFVDDVAIKQSLLAETDVRHRIERTIELLTTLSEATTFSPVNPSLN
jgi:Lon protease-like protein